MMDEEIPQELKYKLSIECDEIIYENYFSSLIEMECAFQYVVGHIVNKSIDERYDLKKEMKGSKR